MKQPSFHLFFEACPLKPHCYIEMFASVARSACKNKTGSETRNLKLVAHLALTLRCRLCNSILEAALTCASITSHLLTGLQSLSHLPLPAPRCIALGFVFRILMGILTSFHSYLTPLTRLLALGLHILSSLSCLHLHAA